MGAICSSIQIFSSLSIAFMMKINLDDKNHPVSCTGHLHLFNINKCLQLFL